MIDRKTIDEIINKTDIVEVVSEFVSLKKAGMNYKGLCPFHNEKTPSFMVSPAKGICHCFSCGKGGNAINFLMEHEQFSYVEALRWLARKYNITIQEKELSSEEVEARGRRESLYIVNEWASNYFQNILYNTEDGQTYGLGYLRQRQLRDDTIAKFQLGYCLPQKDAMSKTALQAGYAEDYLTETGLSVKREDGTLYDKYHGRVIFPIQSLNGKVVAFGGRILDNNKKVAKYINSPESEIYHKSYELYGIHQAKRAIQKYDCCYLVEGYLDVISMHQSGIENVVASSGTSLTEGQIRMLHRFTQNITVLYDGDSAGIHASLRGINMLLAEGMNIKVLLLPDGEDPDSFSHQHTADEFKQYIISHQEDFISFKIRILQDDAKDDMTKRAAVVNDIVESISVIPDAVTRSVYLQECSRRLNIKEEVLIHEITLKREKNKEELAKERRQQQLREENKEENEKVVENNTETTDSTQVDTFRITTPLEKTEEALMKIIVQYGDYTLQVRTNDDNTFSDVTLIDFIQTDLKNDGIGFSHPIFAKMWKEITSHAGSPNFKPYQFFLHSTDVHLCKHAALLLSNRYQLSQWISNEKSIRTTEEKLAEITTALLLKMKYHIIEQQIEAILKQLQNVSQTTSEYNELLNQYQILISIKRELSRQGGNTNISL